jgi:transposase
MAQLVVIGGREQSWRRLLAGWQRSGVSVREYCRQHEISEPSFYWWRRKLQPREPGTTNFLPVRVIPAERDCRTDGGAVEIVLSNGRCLRVRPGFDRGTLLQLLNLLDEGGLPC